MEEIVNYPQHKEGIFLKNSNLVKAKCTETNKR